MRRLALLVVVLFVASTGAFADYVNIDYYEDIGAGYWAYHYEYHRATGTTLIDDTSTWTLDGVYGLDAELVDVTGPIYWDSGVISDDYRSVTWMYTGEPEGPQNDVYGTFDMR